MSSFNAERWQALSPYLDQVLDMNGHERAAWLESVRTEDSALADDLEMLLAEREALDAEGFLEGRAPSLPIHASLAGQTIGAYTLETPVGQGGMGSVWLARRNDGRFEGRVAVKFLQAAFIGRAGEDRFSREGRMLARLTHPHIAHLIDAGVSELGQPYLVLEHVEGTHIDRYCDDKQLDVEARIRLFLDVLDAVAHAHANLIVHRDLKPSNVLVARTGAVKLLDFGIAKLVDTEAADVTALTEQGGWALTPEYAAPEQVTAGPMTTATDVYSLGVLLFVLLTGRHPIAHDRRSPADLVKSIVDGPATRLSDAFAPSNGAASNALVELAARRGSTPEKLRRLLRGDLETVIAKTLKKNPHERYPSVTALADDLRRCLARQPISARPDTLAYRATTFVRRHAHGVFAAAAIVVLLASVIWFYTGRLAVERDRARLEAEKAAKVSDLLTGLLTGADPYASRAGEPTVRGLLDASADRIRTELAGQPDVQAEMLTVMGRIYQRLGAYDKAQPLLEAALATGRRVVGPEHARVAQSLNDLGVLLAAKGQFATAGSVLEEALAMRRKLLGNENKETAVTLSELGRVYDDQGSPALAEPLFREALAVRRKVLGEEHRETATSKSDLALLLWHRGDLAGAEPLFRESLATSRKTLGTDHPNVATSLNNLGLVVLDKRDYPGAEALFREALAIHRRTLGDTHISVATALNNLGHPLREQKKFDEAVSALQEAVRIARVAVGDAHPNVATFLSNLARIHLARDEARTAEPLLREALAIRLRAFRETDWRVGSVKSLLGASLTALGRYSEAEPLLLDALRVLTDVPGPQGRDMASTRVRLASLYEAMGRPDQAAAYRSPVR